MLQQITDAALIERYKEVASQALATLHQCGVDQAEVSISHDQGFCVEARNDDVDTLQHECDTSMDITVYRNGSMANVTTTDMTEAAIKLSIDKAMTIVKYTQADDCVGLADPSTMAFSYPELDLYHAWDLPPAAAIELAVACDRHMRAYDERILPSEGVSLSTYYSLQLYANTHDFMGHYLSSQHQITCAAVAREGDKMQTYCDYTEACQSQQLTDGKQLAQQVAQQAVMQLGARPIKTQTCPVLFAAPVAKSLLRSFVHAISGAALYRQASFLCDHLGEMVFPNDISIYQQPHLAGLTGSMPFDNEGAVTQDLTYIKDGVLEQYVLDAYAARKLNLTPRGNAGGVFNLGITGGELDLAGLCRKMGTGLLVTDLMGQGVNLVTGNYSRGASGFWVENGELQYPVAEITIASNLKDMFRQIIAVGSDTDQRGRVHSGSILVESMTIAGE